MFISKIPNWNKILKLHINRLDGNIYHKLNLIDIGCDINKFNALRLSYNNLPIDKDYPLNTKHPTRFRRYANFNIDVSNKDLFKFTQNHVYTFSQEVDDFRKKERIFQPIESYIIDDNLFQLMTQIIGLTLFFNVSIKKINLSIHQVRLITYPEINADNAPEGIHRDGADYIVSALILNKNNINNGETTIYDKTKTPLYKTKLELGEFIFQEDRELWHDISPISTSENYLGYRDILGFDLKIIE